jgi:hypothetical protein
MNTLLRNVAIGSFVALSLSTASFAQDKALVGTWSLMKNTTTDAAGKTTATFGDKPAGQVTFSANGRYTLIILRPDMPKFASNNRLKGTDQEKMAVNDGVIAHFGKYSVKGKELVLHVETATFPNWNGIEQSRPYTVKGDELRWTNPSASGGGSAELVWKKL